MIKGIVRKLDELGRITLPTENRRILGMVAGEPVDMWLDNNTVRVRVFDKTSLKGIVRNTDDLGRITLPIAFRRSLKIDVKDPLDMYIDGQVICIKPVKLQCVCCGSNEEEKLVQLNGVHICPSCVKKLWEEVMGGSKKCK
jgi:transcriptional pleiotropic regulator of transition state genes